MQFMTGNLRAFLLAAGSAFSFFTREGVEVLEREGEHLRAGFLGVKGNGEGEC